MNPETPGEISRPVFDGFERSLYRVLWLGTRAYVKLLPAGIKMPTPDRLVLERTIFRALFLDTAVRAIMFVGCSGYTAWYSTIFRARPGLRFATIDPDPEVESYGAAGDHRVAPFEALLDTRDEHGRFDVVLINGVFGYGIDAQSEQGSALATAHVLLRPGGRLIIGDSESNVDLGLINRHMFREAAVPGLGRFEYATGSRLDHVFFCFAKRCSRR